MCAEVSPPAPESDSTEAGITARNISEAWLLTRGQIGSICANHVMEILSPRSRERPRMFSQTDRRVQKFSPDSHCLVCRLSPKWDENVEYLKSEVLVQARWAPAWDRLVVRKRVFFHFMKTKTSLLRPCLRFSDMRFPVLKKKRKTEQTFIISSQRQNNSQIRYVGSNKIFDVILKSNLGCTMCCVWKIHFQMGFLFYSWKQMNLKNRIIYVTKV